MRRVYTLFILYLVVLGLFAGSARAQETPDIEKAKAHYAAAEAAMQAGEYAKAAGEYAAAHEITGDPALLYKLGGAYEKAGQCDQALIWYRRYLAEGQPDEQLVAATEERIAACEAGVVTPPDSAGTAGDAGEHTAGDAGAGGETGARAQEIEPDRTVDGAAAENENMAVDDVAPPAWQAPPSFTDRPSSWKSKVAWSSLTAGIGFGIAGAVLALSASAQEQDLENLIGFRYPNGEPAEYSGTVQARYEDLVSKGKTHATWSRVSFAAAGASVGAAVLFFVLDSQSAEAHDAQIVPVVSAESVGMTAGWRF